MPPKLTPLFHLESDEEADKVIQEAEDMKAQLACMNVGLMSRLSRISMWRPRRKPRGSGRSSGLSWLV